MPVIGRENVGTCRRIVIAPNPISAITPCTPPGSTSDASQNASAHSVMTAKNSAISATSARGGTCSPIALSLLWTKPAVRAMDLARRTP